ncbi:MAG TPA: lipase family protein [bacterium]|nr:lipase family protein [bacterium]
MGSWKKAALAAMLVLSLGACGNGEADSEEPDLGASDGAAFDLNLSLELARLCLQSYQALEDFQNGQPFALPAPYTLVKEFFTSEPYEGQNFSGQVPIAFVATQGSTVYVVFRGTKTITEWIADAKIAQVRYDFLGGPGLSEEGFTGVYRTIHQDILDTVKELQASGTYQTLYVTGHSLGGGLATLAGPVYAQDSGFSDPILYTFASPRTGNPVFADQVFDALVKTSWRIANTNDLVPTVPPVETVIFVDNQPHTYFYEHVDTEFDLTFGNPVSGPTDFTDIENNHSLCNYYDSLCDQTSDPVGCKAAAGGADGCN